MKKQYSQKGMLSHYHHRISNPRTGEQLRDNPEPKQPVDPIQANPVLGQPTENNNPEQIDPTAGTDKTERPTDRVLEAVHPGPARQDHQFVLPSEHGGRRPQPAVPPVEGGLWTSRGQVLWLVELVDCHSDSGLCRDRQGV